MRGGYTTILIFVALSLVGLLAISRVPVRFNPVSYGNSLTLSYQWPNASPEALERQVTSPLEGILATIHGVNGVESFSSYNQGNVILNLDKKTDPDRIRFEISSLLRQTYRKFPIGVSYPAISRGSSEDYLNRKNLMSLQMNGNVESEELRKYIEVSLKPKLAQLDGLHTVEVYGGEPQEWVLEYRQSVINNLRISEEDISRAVVENNQISNIGWIQEKSGTRQSISLKPLSDSINFRHILVAKKAGRLIRLLDVATIKKKKITASKYYRVNGRSAVQIVLTADAGVNQLTLADEVKELLKKATVELPSGYGMRIDYDATEYIHENLTLISYQLSVTVAIITLLTIVFFRQLAASLIILSGLLVNFLIATLAAYIFTIEIELFSLAALIALAGFAGGNMVITFYHYYKFQNRIITIPLFGSILIMGATLSVVWLLPENTRVDLTNFAMILMVFQTLSLPVCFWFIPAMMRQFNLTNPAFNDHRFILRNVYQPLLIFLNRFRWVFISFCLCSFGLPFFLLPQTIHAESRFAETYNTTIGSAWYTENVRQYLDKGLGGLLRLFSNYVYDKSYYASNEQTALHINLGMPNHNTVEQMDAALKRIENELVKYNEIDRFITQVYNGQQGSIMIYFKKPYDKGHFPYQIKTKAIAMSTEMSGIDWDIFGVGQGFNLNTDAENTASLNIAVKGYNYKDLDNITLRLKNVLASHPRVQKIEVNKLSGSFEQKDLYTYRMQTDPSYWSRYNISTHMLYNALEKYDVRPHPDFYQLIGDSYEAVSIRPLKEISHDITVLQQEPLNMTGGIGLKTNGHSTLIKEKTAATIWKKDQQYIRNVSFEYLGSPAFGEKLLETTLNTFGKELPMGYTAEKQSVTWWRATNGLHYELICLSLLLIFVIGAVIFESLKLPLTLIGAITFSFIGIFSAFYYSNASFDQGGYASFLLVTGAVSMPVLLVIYEFRHRINTIPYTSVINYFKVVCLTFKSIIYFLITILAGLVPFLILGSKQPFWHSLAVGTVGGIIACIFVILFVLPAFLLSNHPEVEEK